MSKRPPPHRHSMSLGQWFFITFSLFCLLLILRNSDTAITYMSQGLSLCAKTVIPSLFPFMVLSEILVQSGGGEILGKICYRPCRWLFGISGAGVCALLMGLVCGFPVGAKTAASLYRRGLLSPQEFEKLLCFCNIPSSAFLINAVGVSLFASRRFGLLLYGICLLGALMTALLLRLFFPVREEHLSPDAPVPATDLNVHVFTHAVTSGAGAMLNVCAYVIFFSALVGTLGHLLSGMGIGREMSALLFGLFELSGGVCRACAIPARSSAMLLTAFLCGWTGLSVHLQILSLCDDIVFRKRVYFLSKLFQGLFCTLTMAIFLRLLPADYLAPQTSVSTFTVPAEFQQNAATFLNALFIFMLVYAFFKWNRHRHPPISAQ